jgi:ribonuclease P protein component
LNRSQRLRRPDQFQRVRREGKTWHHALLLLNAAPSRRRQTRCGIVVGKRLGKAVERNRARRRVREAVRLSYASIQPGWDLVFVVRPGVVTAPFTEIQGAVAALLKRGGIWRESIPAQDELQIRG